MDELSTAGEGVAVLISSVDPGMLESSAVVTGSRDDMGMMLAMEEVTFLSKSTCRLQICYQHPPDKLVGLAAE